MFHPLQLSGTSLRRISVSSFYTFGRITLWNCLVLDFHFQGVLFLLLQMHSLLVISLFRLFLSDSVLEGYMILEICSFSRLSNLLADNCRVLLRFSISVVLAFISPLIFVLFGYSHFFFFFFMSLAKVHQFCLSLRKTVLCFINPFWFFCLYFIYVLSNHYYFLPSADFGICLFFFFLEVLTTVIRQEKEAEGIQIGGEEMDMPLLADDMLLCTENAKVLPGNC